MSVGFCYVKGGKFENWLIDCIVLFYGVFFYVRIIIFMLVNDLIVGFVCYWWEVLKVMDFDKICFVGYVFQIEMKFVIYQMGYKIIEVFIIFIDWVEGILKMFLGIIKEVVFGVL